MKHTLLHLIRNYNKRICQKILSSPITGPDLKKYGSGRHHHVERKLYEEKFRMPAEDSVFVETLYYEGSLTEYYFDDEFVTKYNLITLTINTIYRMQVHESYNRGKYLFQSPTNSTSIMCMKKPSTISCSGTINQGDKQLYFVNEKSDINYSGDIKKYLEKSMEDHVYERLLTQIFETGLGTVLQGYK